VRERGRIKGGEKGEGLRLEEGLKVWDKGVGLEVGKRVKAWEKWES
jgi:hypothetical protein